jgi:hypothetical protein
MMDESTGVIYTHKPARSVAILRVCGVIDLVCGVPLTLAAIGLLIAGVVTVLSGKANSIAPGAVVVGVILIVCGPLILWAAMIMLLGRVKLTNTTLSCGGTTFRRWNREDIVAVDIRQKNFGRMPRTVPFVVRRDGRSFPLMPLASNSPQGSGIPNPNPLSGLLTGPSTAKTQKEVVDDLRAALRIGGSDLSH